MKARWATHPFKQETQSSQVPSRDSKNLTLSLRNVVVLSFQITGPEIHDERNIR